MSETWSIEDVIDVAADDKRIVASTQQRLLAELATLRTESAELRKLLGMLDNGSMATAGREMWHELRRYRDSISPPARGEGTDAS